MKRIQLPFRSLLMVWLLIAVSIAESHDDIETLAASLASKSGIAEVVASYPQQIKAHFQQSKSSTSLSIIGLKAQQLLLGAFAQLDTRYLLERFIVDNTALNDRRVMMAWFDSPLGERYLIAEKNASSAQGRLAEAEFLSGLKNNPLSAERIDLLLDFVAATEIVAATQAQIEMMIKSELSGINAAESMRNRKTQPQLERLFAQKVEAIPPLMTAVLLQEVLQMTAYAYRDFNAAEIRRYIDFLESKSGRELVKLYRQAPIDVFGQVIDSLSKR